MSFHVFRRLQNLHELLLLIGYFLFPLKLRFLLQRGGHRLLRRFLHLLQRLFHLLDTFQYRLTVKEPLLRVGDPIHSRHLPDSLVLDLHPHRF